MLACSARMDCEYYGALCIKYFRHAAATACAVLVNIASSRSALPQLSDVCRGRFFHTSLFFLFCPRCSYRTSAVFALLKTTIDARFLQKEFLDDNNACNARNAAAAHARVRPVSCQEFCSLDGTMVLTMIRHMQAWACWERDTAFNCN
jgi:hypothetical protein